MALTRCDHLHAALQGSIRRELTRLRPTTDRPVLLDVGCWDGTTTTAYREALGARAAYGVEVFPAEAERARAKGIAVASVDLEREHFPWADGQMDVVVCNQVFEHLKNIWLPLSEIARVLRRGGTLVFSVPNLAALHNRVALALGHQPTCMRLPGPHVRGYTLQQTTALLTMGDVFRVRRVVGVSSWRYLCGWPLPQLFPGLSNTPVLIAAKVGEGTPWAEFVRGEQTYYAPDRPGPATQDASAVPRE